MSENIEKLEKLFVEISEAYDQLTAEEKKEIMKKHNTKAILKSAKENA